MIIQSEIIADSIDKYGNRLTTFILEYPRYIHAELLTHRVFSKNAASSRAIPINKFIEQVITNPVIPKHWGKNQAGMQANEELSIEEIEKCKSEWLFARDQAVESVRRLQRLGLHKQISNRLLEPWFHIRVILSGTEFENFFALRAHQDAHPDLQELAFGMLNQYNMSIPVFKNVREWHIPFGDRIDEARLSALVPETNLSEDNMRRMIAVARCARVSYFNFEGRDDYKADIKLCNRLFANVPRHLSPAEHVARSSEMNEFNGNFRGWIQYRKFFGKENLRDSRVKK